MMRAPCAAFVRLHSDVVGRGRGVVSASLLLFSPPLSPNCRGVWPGPEISTVFAW